jgi:putative colanic acid biosynthesis acetyltransferase WcaF
MNNPNPSMDLKNSTRWPYSRRTYFRRLLWLLIWATIWKICWKRLPVLRTTILRIFGAKVASKVLIAGSVWIEMPWDLTMDEYVTLGERVTLYNLAPLRIGANTIISQDSYICGGTHDYTDPEFPLVGRPISIGSQVWIAAGAFIGPGVTIGDGAVVGARGVVVSNIEPWIVVGGNPAVFIKKRTLVRPPKL